MRWPANTKTSPRPRSWKTSSTPPKSEIGSCLKRRVPGLAKDINFPVIPFPPIAASRRWGGKGNRVSKANRSHRNNMTIDYCIAAANELTQLADLRWRLHVDDKPMDDQRAYERFVTSFWMCMKPSGNRTRLPTGSRPMVSVLLPDVGRDCSQTTQTRQSSWPLGLHRQLLRAPRSAQCRCRNQLLETIKSWAIGESLELLVVWPSEGAYPFYERAGYRRYPDPVVLRLAPPG